MKPNIYLKNAARLLLRSLSFSALFFAANDALAQPAYYYVNTSSAISNTIPLRSTTNKRQWLFEPADFSASAIPSGNITKLYVRVSESAASSFGTFEVKMGMTTVTSMVTGPWVTGLTTVYSGNNVSFTPTTYGTPAGNWIEIPLQTNFAWNGTSNFVVELVQTGYSPGFSCIQASINNTSLYGTSAAATGTTQARHGQLGFDYQICDSPQNLQATSITPTTATVSWNPTFGPGNYEYAVNNDPNPPAVGVPTTFTQHNESGLTNNTWYYLHVRSECPAGSPNQWSGWSLDSFRTKKPCDTPTNLTVTNVSYKGATASWTAAQYALHYEYAFSTNPAPPTFGNVIFATAVDGPGLKGGRNYYVHVRSVCDDYPYSSWTKAQFYVLAPAGVEDAITKDFELDVYPNPVSKELNLNIFGNIKGDAKITVTDAAGKVVKQLIADKKNTLIDMSGMAAGIYMIQYTDDEHREIIKVTKQ